MVQGDYFRLAQALQLPQPATDGQSSNTNAPTASNESIDAVIRALGGPFEAVFDRGSFIAIHPELRADYVQVRCLVLTSEMHGLALLFVFLCVCWRGVSHTSVSTIYTNPALFSQCLLNNSLIFIYQYLP